MPADTKIMYFQDDVHVVIVAKYLEKVTEMANQDVATIQRWLSMRGLQMAYHKTEAVLPPSRKIVETINTSIEGCDISLPSLRYLGVHIDSRLR